MSDFTWMQVVDAGARAMSTGSDGMTNTAIVDRLRVIYGDIKRNAGEEGGWARHFEAIGIAADRIVILADAVRGDMECIRRLADERNAAREERDELVGIAKKLERERDEAWLKMGRIRNEIDCRIEHGADSNGHLEAIRTLMDKGDRK